MFDTKLQKITIKKNGHIGVSVAEADKHPTKYFTTEYGMNLGLNTKNTLRLLCRHIVGKDFLLTDGCKPITKENLEKAYALFDEIKKENSCLDSLYEEDSFSKEILPIVKRYQQRSNQIIGDYLCLISYPELFSKEKPLEEAMVSLTKRKMKALADEINENIYNKDFISLRTDAFNLEVENCLNILDLSVSNDTAVNFGLLTSELRDFYNYKENHTISEKRKEMYKEQQKKIFPISPSNITKVKEVVEEISEFFIDYKNVTQQIEK